MPQRTLTEEEALKVALEAAKSALRLKPNADLKKMCLDILSNHFNPVKTVQKKSELIAVGDHFLSHFNNLMEVTGIAEESETSITIMIRMEGSKGKSLPSTLKIEQGNLILSSELKEFRPRKNNQINKA